MNRIFLKCYKNIGFNRSWNRLITLCICLLLITACFIQPLTVFAEESTQGENGVSEKIISDNTTSDSKAGVSTKSDKILAQNTATTEEHKNGELHAFYPANAVFSEQMKKYIDDLDSISFAWSRIDAGDAGNLNTVKGKNGNYGFYYPKDFIEPLKYAKSQGKSIQLNIYMDGSDCIKLLSDENSRSSMLSAIVNEMQKDISQGEGLFYDGAVIDFEGLRNTDGKNNTILYQGKPISDYYVQFLRELREEFDRLGKKLYVAVNPGVYYDGYDYKNILEIADRVILMAHDYEPTEKLQKHQIEQYKGYDALEPINSLAPIEMVRKALNEIQSAATDTEQLSKVWLQITFDAAQWQFDAKSMKAWETLADTTLSSAKRLTPLYKTIKERIDNTDGNGVDISYGYNNELQSPYIQYYNQGNKSFNFIIYEDSTSIGAKIDLAKSYHLGGISLWSLSNLPDYNDATGKKFHLNGWDTIITKMSTYDKLPAGSNKYVSFADVTVEKAIREKLGKTSGKISTYELQNIYRLKLPTGVKSLKDLSKLPNLEYLDASGLNIKDITAIGKLSKLRVLYLQRNSISNISALKNLKDLEVLSLNGNQLVYINTLASFTKLQKLYLRENKIINISALSKLTNLATLELGKNSIQKIDSIKNLKYLKFLALDNNQVSDLSALKALTNLKYLDLSNNKISSIKTIKSLTGLESLYLQRNTISDISTVSTFKKLKLLSLNGNNISDLKPLAKLTLLEKLYLKDNKIKSIASLKGLVHLNELYLAENGIMNYAPVKTVYSKKGFLCDFKIN